jgi:hypothetical protein
MKIKRYCGDTKPFVYAVFHGADNAKAQEVLENLCAKGYLVWYEDSFGRRSKKRMEKATLVMLFMSRAASADDSVNAAISFAAMKNIPILTIYLAQTELTPAQKLQLNTYQGLMKYSFESEEFFYEKLYGSSAMQWTSVTPAQKKNVRRKNSISLAVAAAAVFVIVFIVLLSSVGGSVKEGSLMYDFGYTGALSDITDIYIYAIKTMDTNQGASRPLMKDGTDYLQIIETGETLIMGKIENISDFAQLKKLKTLVFTGNTLIDISPLYELNHLEYIDVSCNPVANLDGIGKITSLNTLNIAYTDISDISPLIDCPSLKLVNVSCDMERLFAGVDANFEIDVSDHSWSDWYVTVEPTYTEKGQQQRSCVTCGKTEDETLPVVDLANLGIENLEPHIFGGVEEWGEIVADHNFYGIYIKGVNTEYNYVFRKNGTIISCSGREYLDDDDDGLLNKTHIFPDMLQMQDYDPDATYTLEVADNGKSYTYSIRHKFD